MNRIKNKAILLAAALLLSAIMCMTGAYMPVYAEETAKTEDGNIKAVPVLVVEGNTIYVDATSEGPWNAIQGTVRFDPTREVESYGVMKEFSASVEEQELMGFPAKNVTDQGEFIFTAAYTSADGTGVDYDGHIFYITFKDTSEPIDFTMYDEFEYELLSAAVDGAPEAVTYAPSAEVLAANEAQHEADRQAAAEQKSDPAVQNDANQNADSVAAGEEGQEEGSSRNVLLIIVVIAVVVLAAVAVVVSRKNGQLDETADGQDAPDKSENEAVKTKNLSDQDKD